jgi:hypothetical protein
MADSQYARKPRAAVAPGSLELPDEKTGAATLGPPAKFGLAKSPDFQVRRPDTALFATLQGLEIQSGVSAGKLRRLVLKELVDNACDSADAAGRPGEVEIEALGFGSYRIADQGAGIPGTPDEITALFSLDRPMISSKFWRLPLRGSMGNGIRCIAGSCAATDGTLQVTTRGQRILLKPTRRSTEILSIAPTPEHWIGTEIVIHFGPGMPADGDSFREGELSWAKATIRLAKVAGPAYGRGPLRIGSTQRSWSIPCSTSSRPTPRCGTSSRVWTGAPAPAQAGSPHRSGRTASATP